MHSNSFIVAAVSIMRTVFVLAFVFFGPAVTSARSHVMVEEVYVADSRTNDDRAILIRASGEILHRGKRPWLRVPVAIRRQTGAGHFAREVFSDGIQSCHSSISPTVQCLDVAPRSVMV